MYKYILPLLFLMACAESDKSSNDNSADNMIVGDSVTTVLTPLYVTEPVAFDSDDPAIWINHADPSASLILGTDKMEDSKGGVYVFDLQGKIDTVLTNIDRPNNIDVAYNVQLSNELVDIAVYTERMKGQVRVITLPDMQYIDNGGIPVFEDDDYNAVMGIAIFSHLVTGKKYIIVSRKENPDQQDDYLYQYELVSENGIVRGKLVRKFGAFEGSTEIEAIAVDDNLGYIYYADEGYGIRKYYADPAKGDAQLSVFGLDGFKEDREGISIFETSDTTGYILVSDQQAGTFRVFPREGAPDDPHQHDFIATIDVQANESDGSEVTHIGLNEDFPEGLFVAMSDNRTFELYSWAAIKVLLQQAKKD